MKKAKSGKIQHAPENGMFADERRQRILSILEADNRVEVEDLSRRLGVSSDTIRRDLRQLDARQLLHRTHGGAIKHLAPSLSYEVRQELSSLAKQSIGRLAATLVEEGDAIIIGSGTTAYALARSLTVHRATVITNSLDAALVLSSRPGITLQVLGGRWNPSLHELVGEEAVRAVLRYRVGKVFLGVNGLSVQHGLTCSDAEEALLFQAMIASSQEVIVLADFSKLGEVGFAWVAPLKAIHYLVTDCNADVSELGNTGIQILQTDSET
ncbi:MAG TPA: DeoR/GlpR family DNA-binding transcription regulator [Acidobacteriota bacterium]